MPNPVKLRKAITNLKTAAGLSSMHYIEARAQLVLEAMHFVELLDNEDLLSKLGSLARCESCGQALESKEVI